MITELNWLTIAFLGTVTVIGIGFALIEYQDAKNYLRSKR